MSADPFDRIRGEVQRILGPGPSKTAPRPRELCKARAIADLAEVVRRSGLSQTEFATSVLELDESTLRQYLESGRSLHLLNIYMLRDEDAAVFIEVFLKFLQERRDARERLQRTGTTG